MTKTSKGTFYIVLVAAILALVYFFYFGAKPVVNEQNNVALASFTNTKGEKWQIPKGDIQFNVTSAEKYPKMVIGFINPLDVKVGDIQKMAISINGDTPMKRVWAEVETDNTTKIVELNLVATSTVAAADLMKQPYLVDAKGYVVINDGKNSMALDIIKIAEAKAPIIQYRYEGEWTVVDTHTKTYHTTFKVEDMANRSDSMTLAWSDPNCVFDSGGVLQGDCTPNGPEGFDGSAASMGLQTLTLTSAGELGYNTGGVQIGTGQIVLSGGAMKQEYLYFQDFDGDTYASGTSIYANSAASWSGYVRLKDVAGKGTQNAYQIPVTTSTDCYDADPATTNAELAYPGQTSYYYTNRGDGSFDYNCSNGSIEGGWKKTSDTGPTVYAQISSQGQAPDNLCRNYTFDPVYDGCGQTSVAQNTCVVAKIDMPSKFAENNFRFSDLLKLFKRAEARPPDSAYPTGWFSGSTCTTDTCLATATLYNLCH